MSVIYVDFTKKVNLFHGDCLVMLRQVPSKSVHLICADLPYGTTQCKWDTLIDLDLLWAELKRIITDNGAIVLFAQTPFDKVLGASNLSMLRYEWIWEKTAATGFLNAKKMPLKAHENVLIFYKKLPTYNAQKTTGHERKTAGRKSVNSEVYGKAVKKTNYDSTERYPRSVQVFKHDKQTKNYHPTQKPEALLEYIIKTYSNVGDVVLDFCMGSGTCGVAAKKLNRFFIGMEKEFKYFNISQLRIEGVTPENSENSISHTAKGAYITHEIRTRNTEEKIVAAIAQLNQSESKITKTAVANITGIRREHLSRRYQHIFNELAA